METETINYNKNTNSKYDDLKKILFLDCGDSIIIQMMVSFMIGFICSPWSSGLIYYIISLLLMELFLLYKKNVHMSTRIGVIASSFLGFILGRLIVNYYQPLHHPNDYKRKK